MDIADSIFVKQISDEKHIHTSMNILHAYVMKTIYIKNTVWCLSLSGNNILCGVAYNVL